ncbi:MAG: DUF4190 domain-containing protein [Actinomycetota bacterium]
MVQGQAAAGMKRCPACGEEVRAEAVICRFCRYDFRMGMVPPTAPYAPMYVPQRTNGYAIASLVLGIVNMGIGSILALIFGYKAKREIDESRGAQTGRGLAVAGIVLGYVGIVMFAIWLTIFLTVLLPHWNDIRDQFPRFTPL